MRYLRIAMICLVLHSIAIQAGNQQNQLNHIIEQIKNIKDVLYQKHNKRDHLQEELDKIETQYGAASQQRQQIDQKILQQKQQITTLENASLLNQNQMAIQRRALAEQLRLTYLLQHQSSIQLLLNQQDLNQAEHMLYYYQSLNQYRLNMINQLQNNLEKINNHQQQLYAEYQTLRALQQQQQTEAKNLARMKNNRTQLIAIINQNIHDQKQQLDSLSTNKKRLEQTLAHLTALPARVDRTNFSNLNFALQRGRLPWPTRGSSMHYFNQSIANSELKWNGELITAPDEQPVRAVASGVVVFSKWLEGYGLLIIINHGSGYMTLYGRNHSLYKHEGDKVSAGDLIATVGQSGGYDKPALYFAIRYNAKPLDPNRWCA